MSKLKVEIQREIHVLNGNLLELEQLEREARGARHLAEHNVVVLEPDLTQFDAKIVRHNECIAELQEEIQGYKKAIKACEKWRFEAEQGKKEMEKLQKILSEAAIDPYYRSTEEESRRLHELGGEGYWTPQSRDQQIRETKVKILDLKDLVKRFQGSLAELQAKKRAIQNQYRQFQAESAKARVHHERAQTRVEKVKAQIQGLNAKLGIIPPVTDPTLPDEGPVVERFI